LSVGGDRAGVTRREGTTESKVDVCEKSAEGKGKTKQPSAVGRKRLDA
jgi:hypothetical protein